MTSGMLKEIETVVRQVMTDYGIEGIDRMVTANHSGPLLKVDAQAYMHHTKQVFPSFDMTVWLGRPEAKVVKRTMITFNGHVSPMTFEILEKVTKIVDDTWRDRGVSWLP